MEPDGRIYDEPSAAYDVLPDDHDDPWCWDPELTQEEWEEALARHMPPEPDEEPEVDVEELLKQAEESIAGLIEANDELRFRFDALHEMMRESAERFVSELYRRKNLERQLEEAYAYLLGIRLAVRDEHGDVHLVKLPVQLPEGVEYV